jgi:hypothetical protein
MFQHAPWSAGRRADGGRDEGETAASSFRAARDELAEQYTEAVRQYTADDAEDTLAWAFQLGHRAVNQGLGLREMSAMHERALLEALLVAAEIPDRATRVVQRASDFQAVALAPFERRHRRQVQEHATLSQLNLGLEQWLNATQHKLEAAQEQLREARKAELRRNGSLLALCRDLHGALSLLKGLLGAELNSKVRQLLEEAIATAERVTKLLGEATESAPCEAAAAAVGPRPADLTTRSQS